MQQVKHHQDVTPTHNGRRSLAGATYTKASFMRVMMRVTHLFYKNLSTRKNSVNRDKTPITIFLLLYILVSSPTKFSSFSNSLSPLPHCQQQKILLFLILEVQFPATASSSLLLLPPEEKKNEKKKNTTTNNKPNPPFSEIHKTNFEEKTNKQNKHSASAAAAATQEEEEGGKKKTPPRKNRASFRKKKLNYCS